MVELPSTDARHPGIVVVWIQHPLGFLERACAEAESFKELMLETVRKHGTLSIILYSDEVTPGNVLSNRNKRKFHALYWSIKEFGWPLLSNELLWFTVTSLRSSLVNQISGGVSNLARVALKAFFGYPSRADLRHGVHLNIGGERVLVSGSLSILVQDERAHKFMTHCKGAGGIKPCCLCQNVVLPTSTLLPDATGYCISAKCHDVSKYHLHTNESLRGIQKKLRHEATAGTKSELERLEILLGFKYERDGLLQDDELDVSMVDIFAWDWMHCYLVGGAFEREVDLYVQKTSDYHLGYAVLDAYVRRWEWPKGYAHARECFTDGRFSGTASEQISLAPIIAKFASDIVIGRQNVCIPESESMIAVCDVIGMLSIANSGHLKASDLGAGIIKHLHLREAAYGLLAWKPKDHW
eukprot:896903-Pyramimonas_sp.AAC.1